MGLGSRSSAYRASSVKNRHGHEKVDDQGKVQKKSFVTHMRKQTDIKTIDFANDWLGWKGFIGM